MAATASEWRGRPQGKVVQLPPRPVRAFEAPAPTRQVLLVDGDPGAAGPTAGLLRDHGFEVIEAIGVRGAERAAACCTPALIVLEVGLPDGDGFGLCRRLAERGGAPILILSSRNAVLDRVTGLEFGADDYLPRDCHPLELLARVRALLRRGGPTVAAPAEETADVRLDARRRELVIAERARVRLSISEYALISALLEAPGHVLSRLELQRRTCAETVADRTIDVMASRLRRKLAAAGEGKLLESVRGVGYALRL
jgi:two-component system OmpR family response regulator